MMNPSRASRWGALTLVVALSLSACGGGDGSGEGDGSGGGGEDAALTVTTSFFPMTELAEKVGGEHVDVTQLTPEGADPHSFEMTPKAVGKLSDADLVVFLRTMQPSVDAAVDAEASDRAWDAGEHTELGMPGGDGHDHGDEDGHSHEGEGEGDHAHEDEGGHEGHDHDGHEGHDHGGVDPHYWLDPVRYAETATALGEELAKKDPDHAEDYEKNAEEFVKELEELDQKMSDELTECKHTDLLVSHEAFAYLADRHDFHQVGASGLDGHSEVSPTRLAELTHLVEDAGVSTIYTEPLAPRDTAEALASETGTEVAVLDTAAGLTDASVAEDYVGIMEANTETLRKGQECS
ncbi:metal ABC transporter substrate-binding protein [Kytococcus sp. Marseille-QA3725]